MTERAIVCDTTVLLYLSRTGQTRLLSAQFAPIHVPEAVLLELDMGRVTRRDTIDPRRLAWAHIVHVPQTAIDRLPPNRLGSGERSVLAYAQAHTIDVVGLDDLQARQLAQRMGLSVVGTLGVLLRAKQAALIPTVRPLLDAVIAQGFRMHADVYRDVLRMAQEDAT